MKAFKTVGTILKNDPIFCNNTKTKSKKKNAIENPTNLSQVGEIIIGIDPGLQNLGIGIIALKPNALIESTTIGKRKFKEIFEPEKMATAIAGYQYALLRIKPNRLIQDKLFFIFETMSALFEEYKPKMIIVEDAFIGINKNSGLKLGLARGAILTAIGKHNLAFETLPPKQIKMEVSSNGAAQKEDIQDALAKLLPNWPKEMKFDSSDAIAAAFCGIKLFAKNQQSLSND